MYDVSLWYTFQWMLFFRKKRYIKIKKDPDDDIGFDINGGNMTGIFVTNIFEGSNAEAAGVQVGDKIFKVCSWAYLLVFSENFFSNCFISKTHSASTNYDYM